VCHQLKAAPLTISGPSHCIVITRGQLEIEIPAFTGMTGLGTGKLPTPWSAATQSVSNPTGVPENEHQHIEFELKVNRTSRESC
jgi:hypothetical protein